MIDQWENEIVLLEDSDWKFYRAIDNITVVYSKDIARADAEAAAINSFNGMQPVTEE